jgi:hypothetical protein
LTTAIPRAHFLAPPCSGSDEIFEYLRDGIDHQSIFLRVDDDMFR